MTIAELRKYPQYERRLKKLLTENNDANTGEIARLRQCMENIKEYIQRCERDAESAYIGAILRAHYIDGEKWQYIAGMLVESKDALRKRCARFVNGDKEPQYKRKNAP